MRRNLDQKSNNTRVYFKLFENKKNHEQQFRKSAITEYIK